MTIAYEDIADLFRDVTDAVGNCTLSIPDALSQLTSVSCAACEQEGTAEVWQIPSSKVLAILFPEHSNFFSAAGTMGGPRSTSDQPLSLDAMGVIMVRSVLSMIAIAGENAAKKRAAELLRSACPSPNTPSETPFVDAPGMWCHKDQ